MPAPTVLTGIEALRRWRDARRQAGEAVAVVPTMGNLHAGHEALMAAARREAPRVLATIFVNPTQFGPGEDYATYPRTFERDLERLERQGVEAVFAPKPELMYPHGAEGAVTVEVPGVSEILCGEFRPGHFRGVTSVVVRLFNLTEPDVALFGEKDYQQLVIIRRMAEELFFRTRIVGVPTVREPDGLALSSRNRYLDAEQRARAPALHRALEAAARALAACAPPEEVEREGLAAMQDSGFRAEYFAVRRADDLGPPEPGGPRVILGAGWLGRARLIDNRRLD